MATKNTSDLINDADFYLPDNITEDISAGDVRQRIKDLAGSLLNIVDGGLIIQSETGYDSAITPSTNYAFATKKYVDDGLAGVSSAWGGITGTITDQTDLITYLSTNYLTSATAATTYLKLDASNSPLTGTLTTRDIDIQTGYAIQYNGNNFIEVDTTANNLKIAYNTSWNIANGQNNFILSSTGGSAITSANGLAGFGLQTFAGVTSGSESTAIGYRSLFQFTSGTRVTALGFGTGASTYTGVGVTNENNLVLIGRGTGITTAGVNQGFAVGSIALLRASNQMVLGSTGSAFNEVYLGRGLTETATSATVFIRNTGYPTLASNQANASNHLFLDGSPARGNANASNVGLRYAVTGASGTTLQSVTEGLLLWGNTGNIGLWDATAANFGGGTQVMFVKNAGTPPTTDPTGGIIVYPESGVLKYRDPSGNIVVLDGSGGGSTILSQTEPIIEGSWNGNTDYEYSVAVTGVLVGDFCLVNPDEDVMAQINANNTTWNGYAYCASAGTVIVVCRIGSFISIPSSSIFTIKVIQ